MPDLRIAHNASSCINEADLSLMFERMEAKRALTHIPQSFDCPLCHAPVKVFIQTRPSESLILIYCEGSACPGASALTVAHWCQRVGVSALPAALTLTTGGGA